MRYRMVVPIALAAAAWTGGAADAQSQTSGAGSPADDIRAIELEEEAAVANTDSRRWPHAASLFREAAQLRRQNDPIALADLRTAGAIYGTLGQFERARRTLLELSDRAARFGEVEMAAHVLIDVAHVAAALGDRSAVLDYYERARSLTMSSHLTAEQRQNVAARLERSPNLLASSVR